MIIPQADRVLLTDYDRVSLLASRAEIEGLGNISQRTPVNMRPSPILIQVQHVQSNLAASIALMGSQARIVAITVLSRRVKPQGGFEDRACLTGSLAVP